jgi:O-antigen/teichoic acid export membrane protein
MKDIAGAIGTTAIIQAANIATGILAARTLLPQGRGELAEIMLWAGMLAEIGALGLVDALLYRAATRAAPPRALFAAMLGILAVIGVGLAAIAWFALPVLLAGEAAEVKRLGVAYALAFVPCYFAALFTGTLFQGHLDMTRWNIVRVLVPLGYLALIAIGLLIDGAHVASFAVANVGAHALALTVALAILARRGWIAFKPERAVMRGLLAYGIKVYPADLLQVLRLRLDQALVALSLPAAELGLYAIALTVANAPMILIQTIANVAFPKISEQSTQGGKLAVFGRYLRFAVALSVVVIVTIFAISHWAVPLLFGEAFAPAVPVVNVMLLGFLPYAVKVMIIQALKAWDKALIISRVEAFGLVVAATLLLVLVPRLGLVGAAIAVVIAQGATALAMAATFSRAIASPLLGLLRPTAGDLHLIAELRRMVWR